MGLFLSILGILFIVGYSYYGTKFDNYVHNEWSPEKLKEQESKKQEKKVSPAMNGSIKRHDHIFGTMFAPDGYEYVMIYSGQMAIENINVVISTNPNGCKFSNVLVNGQSIVNEIFMYSHILDQQIMLQAGLAEYKNLGIITEEAVHEVMELVDRMVYFDELINLGWITVSKEDSSLAWTKDM